VHERFGISEGPAEPAEPGRLEEISVQHNGIPVDESVMNIG
jgi:RND superfamily putative drug exporter